MIIKTLRWQARILGGSSRRPQKTHPPLGRLRGPADRSGKALVRLVCVLVLAALGSVAVWRFWPGSANGQSVQAPLTTTVAYGPFIHEVVERGEMESSSNVEIRCEVESRGSGGTTILEIVPEGTYVQKGEFLVKLDDSSLRAELLHQEIVCNTSRSQVIEAQADLESARLSREEYESGTFKEELGQLESADFMAKENLRRAEEYLRYSERLAERGYISEVQLEADRFAVDKAEKELDVARTKFEVLRKYTKPKMLNQLDAQITTAEARLRSRENTYELDKNHLEEIKEQIVRCIITAPSSGQVVYGRGTGNSSSNDGVIEEGQQVRERQVIIRLPDPKNMQVVAKINESRIDLVKEGMKVKVLLDALPDVELRGIVRDVSEYPLPPISRYLEHLKEYSTQVEILDPPAGIRPGMTAEVAIEVEHLDHAVQVPPQAVMERDGRHYCLRMDEAQKMTPHEVEIGSVNEEYVVIKQGLQPGENVVLNPRQYEEQIVLPTDRALAMRDGRPHGDATPPDEPAATPR